MTSAQFSKNIRAIREQAGLTQQEFAERLGLQRQAVYTWERGTVEKPRQRAIIDKICEIFGVTEQDLFGFADGFYSKIHGLPDAAIEAIPSATARLPLVGRIHAGKPQDPEILQSTVELPATVAANHPNGYFLKVEGDCMDKVYPEGCLILVDPDLMPSNGSIAAVSIDGSDFVMRRLHRGAASLMLSPESSNPEHRDIVIASDDGHTVELVGTVVWFQSSKEMA